MPFRRHCLIFAACALSALRAGLLPAETVSPEGLYVREFGADGVSFVLKDHLKRPAFWWPRTLLSYPVIFRSPVKASQLVLCDEAGGEPVPFQLSHQELAGGALKSAVVNFFSDLPSGGTRQFLLRTSERSASTASAPSSRIANSASESHEGNTIVLDGAKLKVRIPDSRVLPSGATVPGPILGLCRDGVWIGDSKLHSPQHAVKRIATERLESGPLFIAYRIGYEFAGGGKYHATVRVVAGYDYIELFEEMQGLSKDEGIVIDQAWTGFHPTHRSSRGSPAGGTCRIDQPVLNNSLGEDPAFGGRSGAEDPSREMFMKLRPDWPNGWGGNRSVSFWDEDSYAGLGVFIPDISKWQDHEYSIWSSSDTLPLRFRYAGGVLHWTWPLATGTRLTGICSDDYASASAVDAPPLGDQEENTLGNNPALAPAKLALPVFLSNRYGELSLNRVKDWVLDYPEHASRPAPLSGTSGLDAAAFCEALDNCSVTAVADGMYHPVELRDLRYWIVRDFSRLASGMTPEQRDSTTALLLLAAYVSADEEFSPLKNSLGGHPHFMADLCYPLLAAAWLFPDHPMAGEWRDQYEKFVELMTLFHTRPPVPQWEARGGRWTESLAYYNGAFLEPVLEANRLGLLSDGRNRIATPALALMGDYLAGTVTAPVRLQPGEPWPDGTALTPENGFERLHPPQGAHADRRAMNSDMLLSLGEALKQYRPAVAESLLWAGAASQSMAAPVPANRGSNPGLTSAKFTGYGVVLRAAAGTPDEVSVFLQQIDKGPNYRWGFGNEGGCGDLYYYAKGRSFSGHGSEDAGDRRTADAEFTCNTAVYKDKTWRSIGMNELTRPLYNLEVAQFAELVPRRGADAYSWPEYAGRSVMLVGSDYLVVYDAVNGAALTRTAWTLLDGKDAMPKIIPIKGGTAFSVESTSRGKEVARAQRLDSYVAGGDRMLIVSHRPEVKIVELNRKRKYDASPVPIVETPTSRDYLFQDSKEIVYDTPELTFHGTAGLVRRRTDGTTELALFHGSCVGSGDIVLRVSDPETGVSLVYGTLPDLKGVYFTRTSGTLILEASQLVGAEAGLFPAHTAFYIDGAPVAATVTDRKLTVRLPAGQHRWEAAAHLPEPMPPAILRTENRSGGARVFFNKVAGAERYRVELSRDDGAGWKPAGDATSGTGGIGQIELRELPNDRKVHVRAVAVNACQESRPSAEYPVYVTGAPPLPPDGLKVDPSRKQARVSWGEVLGVTEYRLYRRERAISPLGTLPGEARGDFKEIYRGLAPSFTDSGIDAVPPLANPGVKANAAHPAPVKAIYEYAATAVNGNGESAKSSTADTNPASWRNWYPPGIELRFRRQTAFWLPPYVTPEQVPSEYP